tara:strand:+ start:5341 stop:5853 length:513 start_codon:yes stop_codon:yes gene_type:complete
MLNIKYENKSIKLNPAVEIGFLIFFILFSCQFKSYANKADKFNTNENNVKHAEIINPFHKETNNEELRQVPNQKTSSQEKNISLARNPFTSYQANSDNGNLILSRNIVFTGMAKVGEANIVFADTDKGRSFLKVGSDLGNGYSISSIDIEKSIINISNGILTYKVDFKKR